MCRKDSGAPCLFGLGGPANQISYQTTINQSGLLPNMPAIQGQQHILNEI
jgi:hypothetical protein